MKTWLAIGACLLLLSIAVVPVAYHSKFYGSQPPVAQSPATTLFAATHPPLHPAEADAAPVLSLSTIPDAPIIPPTPVIADPGANRIDPDAVVPVHVVTRQNTLHPGIAYDLYNDADHPLNLRVTLNNSFRMPKTFDCHLEPGKGSYCEIGFNQGFSGSRGDTLTIEAIDYLPLIFTP